MTYMAISANTGSTAQRSYNVAKGLNSNFITPPFALSVKELKLNIIKHK